MAARAEPAFLQVAPRDLKAVLKNQRALTKWILREKFQRNRIAYRAFDYKIGRAGGCVFDVGLFSRFPGNDDDPWQRTLIVHHLTDGKGASNTANHTAHLSPYMSISTSPDFIVRLTDKRINENEIAILDLDMLDIMGVRYRQTASLRSEFDFQDNEDGATYTSDTHYLVYEHIPQCCVLGFMREDHFKATWTKKLDELQHAPNCKAPAELNWEADLEHHPNLRQVSVFGKDPRFNHGSDAIQVKTPNISGGRFQRTINAFGDTTLNTEVLRGKRARETSPERTTPSKRGPGNTHDSVVRTLWAPGSSAKP